MIPLTDPIWDKGFVLVVVLA